MPTFSQRKGVKPIRETLQIEAMDDDLRAQLWNVLHFCVWDTEDFMYSSYGGPGRIHKFAESLWFRHFKKPVTSLPDTPQKIMAVLERQFFDASWNEVYDLLEAVVEIARNATLERAINKVLEEELAGYRLVKRQFTDITHPQEIAALEQALAEDQFGPVAQHVARALELLSDRKKPDYRNSIKESISAVESLVRILTGNDKATLNDALRVLERKKKLHSALRDAFGKLYGYTRDSPRDARRVESRRG
jgi:AbiJ N-terminal domain 4